ncbi:heparinase II/III family protein, partial [candidate division KSB1 bacterium]|nr:heparinase II/III family protein [candidate division KSB1 bacterium]
MYRHILFIAMFATSLGTLEAQSVSPHPFYFTEQSIQTAQSNIEKHAWAEKLFDEIRQSADQAAALSNEELRTWFSEQTPISQCDCPYCNHHWQDYTWSWDKDCPDELRCNYCGGITSAAHFPENDTLNIIDPQGQIHPHPVYRDSTGKRFPFRQLIAFHKERYAYGWIETLGMAYAITGELRYAQKAAVLLCRLAEVYPAFGIHDNFRFERYPFGWAGKLRMWHYADAYTLQDCAATYDAIYHSGALDDRDKELIENQLFRTGLDFLTAVRPTQGISNDIPYRYAGVAMLGRTLQDHDAIAWVLDPEEGFFPFIDKLFFGDGTWHERTGAYHTMVIRPLPEIVDILQGYSDPPSYRGIDRFDDLDLRGTAKLGEIFSVLLDLRLPDGTIPPVNDSPLGHKPEFAPLEALYKWSGDPKWLIKADQAAEGRLHQTGTPYSLFNRDPEIDALLTALPAGTGLPDSSRNHTGMGLSLLRRGSGAEQVVFGLHHPKYTSPHTHYSALSTILYADGREMLSDFGYPSFSTDLRMRWYVKTLSHNTLTVDTRNQYAPYSVANWLHNGSKFTACEAEAWEAYRHICEPYFRQIALIDAPDGRVYAVDIFRAHGGSTHDWALHGEGETLTVSGVEQRRVPELAGCDYAYDYL